MSSTVPERRRNTGEKKWNLLIRANELTCYTLQICTNENTFLPRYQGAITNNIIHAAIMIYVNCWDANQIKVAEDTPQKDREERRSLQDQAIRYCNRLLALMQIAQRLLHLKASRIEYWGKHTKDVREGIKRWQESDRSRYKT